MKKLYFSLLLLTGIAKAQIVNIPDANFKAKLLQSTTSNDIAYGASGYIQIDSNNDGEIQLSEALQITKLRVNAASISNLDGVSDFINLIELECYNNNISSLDVSTLTQLKLLRCEINQISTLDLTGLNNLRNLSCYTNQISTLVLPNLANFESLSCAYNYITALNLAGAVNLGALQCDHNGMNTLDLTGCTNLGVLVCHENNLTSLNLSGFGSLYHLQCQQNQIAALNLSGVTNLEKLECQNNLITAIDFTGFNHLEEANCSYNLIATLTHTGLPALKILNCGNNELTTLNLTGVPQLYFLNCFYNQLTNLDIANHPAIKTVQAHHNLFATMNLTGLPQLTFLNCSENPFSTIDVSALTALEYLAVGTSNLTSIDLTGLNSLISVDCAHAQFTSLDLTGLNDLQYLYCQDNQLTTLDVSMLPSLKYLTCSENNLTSFNAKNGSVENYFYFDENPNLEFICADEGDLSHIQMLLTNYGYTDCVANSYCSFTPGGSFNTITGTQLFDADNNGCDASDLSQSFIKVKIDNGTEQGMAYTNSAGNYTFLTDAGNFTLNPDFENPAFFNASPANATVSFPTAANLVTSQNFCITANGIHPDLEIVVTPIVSARPGFDAVYKIVYKNKGNQMMTQNLGIVLSYNDSVLTLIGANPATAAQTAGSLNWDYANLLPFESRSIEVSFHVNAPTDTPAVNINDILTFTAEISPNSNDETVADNTFILNQTVVGSYDPNDITCLEGDVADTAEIGKYLHYVINFENTGTADAENIIVKDIIDDTKFDVSSLVVLNSSHLADIRVNGNVAEFMMKNIYLATGGHGNILLKIKTRNTLAAGDLVSKSARIYFDYNFPVITNDANTLFSALGIESPAINNSITIFPNPVADILEIKSSETIKSVQLFDAQGRLLMTQLSGDVMIKVDISTYSSGIYYVKVSGEKGIKTEKIMKK